MVNERLFVILTEMRDLIIDYQELKLQSMMNRSETLRKEMMNYFKEIRQKYMSYTIFKIKRSIKDLKTLKLNLLDLFSFFEASNTKVLNFTSQDVFDYIDSCVVTLRKRMISLRRRPLPSKVQVPIDTYLFLEGYS